MDGAALPRGEEDDFFGVTSGAETVVEDEEFVLLNIVTSFQKIFRIVNTTLEVNFIM